MYARLNSVSLGRANPLAPALVVLAGLVVFVAGSRWVGAGVAAGAILALLNGILLSRRVEIAADTGDVGRALLTMQLGLLTSFAVVAVVTVVLVHLSLAMTVAAAAGFGVSHIGMLAVFYWTRGRQVLAEGKAL